MPQLGPFKREQLTVKETTTWTRNKEMMSKRAEDRQKVSNGARTRARPVASTRSEGRRLQKASEADVAATREQCDC